MAKKIFLIDDDSDDRELFSEALAAVDSSVVYQFALDGEEAVDKLTRGKIDLPDLIFLDINLPAMSGWECLINIKKNENSKAIPVIMYSTSSHVRDKRIAKELGALCFITKPNDYKEIKNMLASVVANMHQVQVLNVWDDFESFQN